ncbi:MAG: hypothetical protein FWD16_02910 [Clostridia bacterium]|nr:hypothetical protein [Clostridia bacterium]
MCVSNSDRHILRDLAKKQFALSQQPCMQPLIAEWTRHNRGQPGRPIITVELATFRQDIVPPLLRCEGEQARGIEHALYSNFVNHELFCDDTVVRDYFPVHYRHWFRAFNIQAEVERAGGGLGQHIVEKITDFETERHLLQKSAFGVDKTAHLERMELLNDIFGDILPVRLEGQGLYAALMNAVVHLMGMETMYIAMLECPEEFRRMMDALTGDYIEYLRLLEREGVLLPTAGMEGVAMGTYCFSDELPASGPVKTTDLWGHINSQETVSVSPAMFEELVFPCYQKIAEQFGLLTYGCCEAVDPFWEKYIKKLHGLRKVSIAPWCNEAYMGEQLRGTNMIYHRKPSPNFLGVGREMDEDGLRAHIRQTAIAAKGCCLELTQRDVYRINGTHHKVRRFVEILRQETEGF